MSLFGVKSLREVAYKAEMVSCLFGWLDHARPTAAQHVACPNSAYCRLDADSPLSGSSYPAAIKR